MVINKFSGKNVLTFEEYTKTLQLNGLKESTIKTKIWNVYALFKYLDQKDANDVIKDDIEGYILHRRETRKPKTVHNDIIDIRLFFNWLKPDNDFFTVIKSRSPKNQLPVSELLLQDDVKVLLASCQTQRDRALISVLWDSAARVSEILDLNIGKVQFDKYGATVIVNGKTGMRKLRLINSVPDLQIWLNQHPERDNHNAPLFVTLRKKGNTYPRLNVRTIQNKLKTIAKDAGIKKNIHPHAFRHGRLTDLVKQGFKEMELRIIAGWGADSSMPATYIHLSGDDVDKKQLQIAGFKDDETEAIQDDIKPVECPRCRTKNPHDAKYCSTCSMVLDAETAVQLEAATKTTDNNITDIISSRFDDLKKELIDEMLQNRKN
ncbi:tyrosine-type recombinase/integrase [candidate division WOR-3 bacterium]|nr:tyrosine-type recombinase/integrase [candidate division WOR-3 bacterium]